MTHRHSTRCLKKHGLGIVHIGTGAFHRAHQAPYTQDTLMARGGDWRIQGISLRGSKVADRLNAQEGQYTLVVREHSGTRYQTIRVIESVLSAAHGLSHIEAALDRPDTRIVSLTVTEKAYNTDNNHGNKIPNVIHVLTNALKRRRQRGQLPFTLLSCDNLANNGEQLRQAVLRQATRVEPDLADWIADKVCFPSTMVDRITPATTSDLIDEVAASTGWSDQAPVETEAFSQWVIEDNFTDGARPQWEVAGAQLVTSVVPFEQMKLRMLNGAHSLLAYAGYVAGKALVRDVMETPALAGLVARHMEAAADTVDQSVKKDNLTAYQQALLVRFRNPHIAHETFQIATDGSQKLPQRIFAPALDALTLGHDLSPFAFAFAAWLHFLKGTTETGNSFDINDPRHTELCALPDNPRERVRAVSTLSDLLPAALASHGQFIELTAAKLQYIVDHGMTAAVDEELTTP